MADRNRPYTFGEREIELIKEHAPTLTVDHLAELLGVSRRTLYDIMDRQPEVKEAYQYAKVQTIHEVANSLISKAVSGDVGAMCFYLKTQGGYRETQVIHQENKEVKSFSDMYGDS